MVLNIEAASKYHRLLIITYGIGVLIAFGVMSLDGQPSNASDAADAVSPWLLLELPILCMLSYFGFRLAKAIGKSGVATAVLMFIPTINFFALLLLINQSNKAFKDAGLKIGFFGGVKK